MRHSANYCAFCLLLAVNAVMFVIEVIAGTLTQSKALVADSFDMLADAIVYSISLSCVVSMMSCKHQ
jgi:Co/Zn/Cd efflux system component